MSIHPRVLFSTTLAGLALACVQTLPGADDEVGDTGSESATGDSETDSTTTSSTETTDATETGPMLCTGPQDCMDAAMPFCNMDGACVACDGMPEPDVACAGADAELPVCFASECVACAEGKVDACVGTTPICDTALNVCEGCSDHGQCPDSACNLAEGNCMDPSVVVHVDGDTANCPAADGTESNAFCKVSDALSAAGIEAVLIVHDKLDMTEYTETNTIAKSIAIFAANGENPSLRAAGLNPTLTVSANGALFLRDMQIATGASTGITINGGQAWIEESVITANAAQGVALNGGTAVIERSRIVNNTGGGIVVDGGGMLMLENSFVGGFSPELPMEVTDGMFEIVYSTIAASAGPTTAFECVDGTGSTIRNSIVVFNNGADPNGGELVCPDVELVASALEGTFAGNLSLGDMNPMWFTGFNAGDFHLSAMHPPAIDTAALWQSGDPATDIEGDARPTTDGTNDFAGADRIP